MSKCQWLAASCSTLILPMTEVLGAHTGLLLVLPCQCTCMQILGREVGNFYTRSELKHLIQIHVENPEHPVCDANYPLLQ